MMTVTIDMDKQHVTLTGSSFSVTFDRLNAAALSRQLHDAARQLEPPAPGLPKTFWVHPGKF